MTEEIIYKHCNDINFNTFWKRKYCSFDAFKNIPYKLFIKQYLPLGILFI